MAIYKLQQHESESAPTSVTLDDGSGVILNIPFVDDNICLLYTSPSPRDRG